MTMDGMEKLAAHQTTPTAVRVEETRMVGLRPKRSATGPPRKAEIVPPTVVMLTTTSCSDGDSPSSVFRLSITPDTTLMLNPNSRPQPSTLRSRKSEKSAKSKNLRWSL